ncbi:hypothetical protein FB45DRAFT_365485 [Roridomyces roridus]|uniref:Uncharacterized protein n=1 Tax=Roridomyces roridus TaxID=1738132 RepID=A0AAD7C8T2_9AGAR|nr:hypothetical protein FB45DRAFT_365485 [Roridomyces roridus]
MVKFPPLELATLQLSFHRENSCDTHIVFAMRPRKLILRVWRPEYRTMVSKYLVHLGPVLQALELSRLPVEDILAFRFFANINLTRLILDNALRYDGSSENPETHVLVNPILPPLLSHIAEQAPLRHLILRVTITEPPRVTPSSPLILHMIAKRRVDSSGWLPLANLLEVLDRPPLSSMTIPIEFPMGGAPIVLSNSGLRRVRRGFEQRMRGVMPDERFIAFHGN